MGSFIAFAVVAVLAIFVFAWILEWRHDRATAMLQKWAAQNGYQIIRQEHRAFFKGPFFWTSGKSHEVYFVVVEDSGGCQKSAWVRCGGFWLGLWSDHVAVRWDN
jgi:hypothetical protein